MLQINSYGMYSSQVNNQQSKIRNTSPTFCANKQKTVNHVVNTKPFKAILASMLGIFGISLLNKSNKPNIITFTPDDYRARDLLNPNISTSLAGQTRISSFGATTYDDRGRNILFQQQTSHGTTSFVTEYDDKNRVIRKYCTYKNTYDENPYIRCDSRYEYVEGADNKLEYIKHIVVKADSNQW